MMCGGKFLKVDVNYSEEAKKLNTMMKFFPLFCNYKYNEKFWKIKLIFASLRNYEKNSILQNVSGNS